MILCGARWFDSIKMEFRTGDEIWIKDGKICGIGGGFEKGGDEVLDLTGTIILPGWIDAHVHLTLSGEIDPIDRWQTDGVVVTAIKAGVNFLRGHLRGGVTVVRDVGGDGEIAIQLRKAVQDGVLIGPEILTAGKALTMTGGHIYQISKEVDGKDAARKGAREELKKGVDLLKVIATGGILTPGVQPGSAQLSEEEIAVVVEEAHKAGRKVASHAEGNMGIRNSLRAGIDTLEHGIGLDEEAVRLMQEREVILVPTLVAPRLIVRHRRELPAEMVEKAEPVVEEHKASFALAWRSGCRVAVGTDAGTPFNVHGAFHTELAELLAEGMKVEEVLQAASLHGAMALGIADRCGSIEVGKEANLTVIADRLGDQEWYRNVQMVFVKGQVYQNL